MIFSRLFGKKDTSSKHKSSASKVNDNHTKSNVSSLKKEQPLSDEKLSEQLTKLNTLLSGSSSKEAIADYINKIKTDKILLTWLTDYGHQHADVIPLVEKKLEDIIHKSDISDLELDATIKIFNCLNSINLKRKLIRGLASQEESLKEVLTDSHQNIVAGFAAWSQGADVRHKAVKHVHDSQALKFIIKNSSDKSTSQIAKETLQYIKQKESEHALAQDQIVQVLAALKKLSQFDVDNLTSGRFHLLQKHWDGIDDSEKDSDSISNYDHLCQLIQSKISTFVDKESALKQLSENKSKQIELLRHLCQSISQTNNDNARLLVDNLDDINTQWMSIVETGYADKNLNEDFGIFYSFANKITAISQKLYLEDKLASQDSSQPSAQRDFKLLEKNIKALTSLDKEIHQLVFLKKIFTNKPYLSDLDLPLHIIEDFYQYKHALNKDYKSLRQEMVDKSRYIDKKILALKSQIRQKNLLKSNKLFHYIENNINDLQGSFKQKSQDKLDKVYDDLHELRSLHDFVTLPKKEQLCYAMENLAREKLPHDPKTVDKTVDERQERIKKIQNQWRSVMSHDAEADEILWDRFHSASDKAYEPIRSHFKELDQLRMQNLEKRKQICAQLRLYIDTMDWQQKVDWKLVREKQKSIIKEWHDAFPIFYSDNKPVQKLFNDTMDDLRHYLDQERAENVEIKESLLFRAMDLATPFLTQQQKEGNQKLHEAIKKQALARRKRANQHSTNDLADATESSSENNHIKQEQDNEAVLSTSDAVLNDEMTDRLSATKNATADSESGSVSGSVSDNSVADENANTEDHKSDESNDNNVEASENIDLDFSEADVDKALEQYKRLQVQWKNVGIVFIGQGNKLWAAFKTQGDYIYKRKRDFLNKIRQQETSQIKELDKIIAELNKLAKLGDNKIQLAQEKVTDLKAQAEKLLADKNPKLQSVLSKKIDNAVNDYSNQLSGLSLRRQKNNMQNLRRLNKTLSKAEAMLTDGSDLTAINDEIRQTVQLIDDISLLNQIDDRVNSVLQNQPLEAETETSRVTENIGNILLDLEVMLGLHSPESEKKARMEYQLELLKKGNNSKLINDEQKLQYLHKAEIKMYQTPFTNDNVLFNRLKKIIASVDK